MSNKHLHLLQNIYHDPPSSNIHWREVESLLTHLGATIESAVSVQRSHLAPRRISPTKF